MSSNRFKYVAMTLVPVCGIVLALVLASGHSEATSIVAAVTSTAAATTQGGLSDTEVDVPLVKAGRGPYRQTEAGLQLLVRAAKFENVFFERNLDDTPQSVVNRLRPFADDSYIMWLETHFSLEDYETGRKDGYVHRAEASPQNMEVLHTGKAGDEVWLLAKFTVREFEAATDQFIRSFQVEHRTSWLLDNGEWFVTDLPADTS